MSGIAWRWARSHPNARTDRLPTVPAAATGSSTSSSAATGGGLPEQRRPRTLRLPRVRRVILRDPVDQVAAEQLEAVLRGAGVVDAGVVLAEAVIGRHLVADATWQRTLRAAAIGLDEAAAALAPTEARASRALAASSARCPRCTAAELCHPHQQVLWRWWDLRDARAVAVVNDVVAALSTTPTPGKGKRKETGQ